MNTDRITTGRIAMMVEAHSSAIITPCWVSIFAMATGSVRVLKPVKFKANMNSFQDTIKLYTEVAMTPGAAKGRTTLKYACTLVQPSI